MNIDLLTLNMLFTNPLVSTNINSRYELQNLLQHVSNRIDIPLNVVLYEADREM